MAKPPSPLTLAATEGLLRIMQGEPTQERLAGALRYLAKWRSQVLEATLVKQSGEAVLSGPFRGMLYPVRAAEGSRTARLLGAYEAGLIPVIEQIIAREYPLIIDVGCAEGYYAVGLALRMQAARIMARDADPAARDLCGRMAAANGVEARVEIGGEMGHEDFSVCEGQKTLVLCDIEGAEEALIDPVAAPGLLQADILIEVHEGIRPGLTSRIAARFEPTHRITRIDRTLAPDALPDWAGGLSDLDRLLLLWEWRAAPTPWLWMERR